MLSENLIKYDTFDQKYTHFKEAKRMRVFFSRVNEQQARFQIGALACSSFRQTPSQ